MERSGFVCVPLKSDATLTARETISVKGLGTCNQITARLVVGTCAGGADTFDVKLRTNLLGDTPTNVGEVHSITVDAGGGTFDLVYAGQTASSIAYNATAATIEAALVGLSNIAPGDVTVSGGPGVAGGATPYYLTWDRGLGNVAAPTTVVTSLTGGAGTAAVATVTAGTGAVWTDLITMTQVTAGTSETKVLTRTTSNTWSDNFEVVLYPGAGCTVTGVYLTLIGANI